MSDQQNKSNKMTDSVQNFEAWAIVELFGHNKIAGKCSEQNVAGTNFLRVDVPSTTMHPLFTRLLNHGAIYAINPVTEEVARAFAERINSAPIEAYDARVFLKNLNDKAAEKRLDTATQIEEDEEEYNDR